MAGIWQYLRNLFREAAESSPSNPAIHTVITRSETEKDDYDRWEDSLIKRRLVDWLSDQYAVYRVAAEDIDEGIDFLNTPSSKGFVIHFYKTRYTAVEVKHLFDYLKNQMRQQLNYKLQLSDRRTYNRPDWVETVERYYLKPRPEFVAGQKTDQAYGNVTIELLFRDDQVHQLKLQATSYHDHQYQEAADFHDLMQAILK